VVSLNF